MTDVCDLRDDFRVLPLPDGMRCGDALAEFRPARHANPVEIERAPDLKPERAIGFCEEAQKPGRPSVVIAGIARAANHVPAAVANSRLVVEIPAAGRKSSFDQPTDEVHRDEAPAELDHLRPADGGLQPLSVVKRGVPDRKSTRL